MQSIPAAACVLEAPAGVNEASSLPAAQDKSATLMQLHTLVAAVVMFVYKGVEDLSVSRRSALRRSMSPRKDLNRCGEGYSDDSGVDTDSTAYADSSEDDATSGSTSDSDADVDIDGWRAVGGRLASRFQDESHHAPVSVDVDQWQAVGQRIAYCVLNDDVDPIDEDVHADCEGFLRGPDYSDVHDDDTCTDVQAWEAVASLVITQLANAGSGSSVDVEAWGSVGNRLLSRLVEPVDDKAMFASSNWQKIGRFLVKAL